jgi:VWFA-related protein
MRSIRLLSILCIAAGAIPVLWPLAASQVPQEPAPRFRSGVELVEVAVLARDRDGKPVADLRRDEIEVAEAGVPQQVVAFEHISITPTTPSELTGPPPLVRDVATNEGAVDARVFVLVLDGNHVAARRARNVRATARQFVEQHVGPGDIVAVLSPGAVSGATQDFTTDKARLLAAIDQFSGMKMTSAVIELDRERAAQERGGVAVHAGKDPSDGERAVRARAVGNVLEAVAGHLERIPGRRKTLLLFSEGIDYDTADVMGQVQRHASEVMWSTRRAIGALMRTNVALYAIDPRALNSADGDLTETPLYSQGRADTGFGQRTVANEQADSIRMLHSLSESTGGFAAVDRNEFAAAFQRIVEESSSYYVVGYTPQRPAKPGEFRPISVKVTRPGVRVSARNGYIGKTAVPIANATATPSAEPALTPPWSARGRGRGPDLPGAPAAPVRTTGVPAALQELLASPLPQPGLPLRVQAVAVPGSGRKADVRLIVEVLGRSLQLTERDGRFTDRIELAFLTVNDEGRGANGTSTTIDLRLPPDDLTRVRATGVRWLSSIELPPGHHQLRVAARSVNSGASGMLTQDVAVPPPSAKAPQMSGVTMTSAVAVLMLTKGKPWAERTLQAPPSAARTYVRGDRIAASVDVFVPSARQGTVIVTARLEHPDGRFAGYTDRYVLASAAQARKEDVGFALDTATVAAGRYVLRVKLEGMGSAPQEHAVPFEVVAR